MTQIERDGIAGQKPAHQCRNRGSSRSQKEMKMIGKQRPSIASRFCSLEIGDKPFHEAIAVLIIEKDSAPLNPSTDDVMKGSRDIDP
jgi:hypothetical protein